MNESAADGTYEVEITATAVSGEIRGTDTKKVTVINTAPIPVIPVLTCTTPSITLKKGGTIASLTVRSNVTPLEWLLSGELPEGLTYSIDGNKFVISGIVSQNSEARDYVYTVRAMNEVGISETLLITITVTVAASVTPNYIEAPAEEVSVMTNEEIKETFGGNENIVLTGETENLSEIISKLENLTEVKTLDLSLVTGVSELKLENTSIENITLKGNQSITTVEVTGNEALTTLNLAGSKVEMVDAKGCENLKEVNFEGCENLETLDCSNNSLLILNASGFKNLRSLESKHQRAIKPISRLMNFIDLLLGRGRFAVSAANEDSTYLENVKNLKAYDESGNELSVKFDSENGEVEFSGEPAKITYDYDTGFKNTMMDVGISASESESENKEIRGFGSSHGGCTLGFGAWALAVLMLLLVPISKTKTTK